MPSQKRSNRLSFAWSIEMLLFRRGPTAVGGFVVTIIIREAVKRMLRGWFPPHVFEEVLEAIPAPAKANAASAIVAIFFITWVAAAFSHAAPRIVFYGSAPSDFFPVSSPSSRSAFPTETSAATRSPLRKIIHSYECSLTAGAFANPNTNPVPFLTRRPNRGKPARDFTSKIQKLWHGEILA